MIWSGTQSSRTCKRSSSRTSSRSSTLRMSRDKDRRGRSASSLLVRAPSAAQAHLQAACCTANRPRSRPCQLHRPASGTASTAWLLPCAGHGRHDSASHEAPLPSPVPQYCASFSRTVARVWRMQARVTGIMQQTVRRRGSCVTMARCARAPHSETRCHLTTALWAVRRSLCLQVLDRAHPGVRHCIWRAGLRCSESEAEGLSESGTAENIACVFSGCRC